MHFKQVLLWSLGICIAISASKYNFQEGKIELQQNSSKRVHIMVDWVLGIERASDARSLKHHNPLRRKRKRIAPIFEDWHREYYCKFLGPKMLICVPKTVTFRLVDYVITCFMVSQTPYSSYFPTLELSFHLGFNQWDFFVVVASHPPHSKNKNKNKNEIKSLIFSIQYQNSLSTCGACSEVVFAFE